MIENETEDKNKINKNVLAGWIILVIIGLVTSLVGINISKSFQGDIMLEELQQKIIKSAEEIERQSEKIKELIEQYFLSKVSIL